MYQLNQKRSSSFSIRLSHNTEIYVLLRGNVTQYICPNLGAVNRQTMELVGCVFSVSDGTQFTQKPFALLEQEKVVENGFMFYGANPLVQNQGNEVFFISPGDFLASLSSHLFLLFKEFISSEVQMLAIPAKGVEVIKNKIETDLTNPTMSELNLKLLFGGENEQALSIHI